MTGPIARLCVTSMVQALALAASLPGAHAQTQVTTMVSLKLRAELHGDWGGVPPAPERHLESLALRARACRLAVSVPLPFAP